MKIKYKNCEIEAKRERALGGWDSIYYYILDLEDNYFIEDGFSADDQTPIRDFIKDLKKLVDDYRTNPLEYREDEDFEN